MNDPIDAGIASTSAGPSPSSAGGRLRAAREAAGLSLDAVAQQLKLAPRQVQALEDDDWARLPGRTFVRGFARNYARYVQLDPDAVLALLPAPDSAPALERPTLAASRRPMGEIPTERSARPSVARWLLPLLLIAIVAAAALYELSNGRLPSLPGVTAPVALDNTAAAPSGSTPSASVAAPGPAATPLPNPAAEAGSRSATTRGPTGATTGLPGSTTPAATPPTAGAPDGTAAAAAGSTATSNAAPAGAARTGDAAVAGDVSLVLTFRGTSWAEVKDANGRVLLQITGGPGMTQTVSAAPPLELALGNAPVVGVTYRGQAIDLAPYTRSNVARVALK